MKIYLLSLLGIFLFFSSFTLSKDRWDRDKIVDQLAEDGLRYLSDTVMDVSGDGVEYLVVHAFISANYPFTASAVYLGTSADSLAHLFINPTYFPSEKRVRFIYGTPVAGYILLGKYKWENEKVELEEKLLVPIHGAENDTFGDNDAIIIQKSDIPEEYFSINEFDRFAEYLD